MKSPWMLSAVACFGLMLSGCSATPSSSGDKPAPKPEAKPTVSKPAEDGAGTKNPTPGAGKEGAPANPAPC